MLGIILLFKKKLKKDYEHLNKIYIIYYYNTTRLCCFSRIRGPGVKRPHITPLILITTNL